MWGIRGLGMIRVLALGCFDCLHPGHIAHLRAARALGDQLTVAVTHDEFVNKGPGRPLFTFDERIRSIRELRCVDDAFGFDNYEEAIRKQHPDIYCKGIDWYDGLPEKSLIQSLGGVVKFLNVKPVYSSTKIITGEMLRERIDAFVESC